MLGIIRGMMVQLVALTAVWTLATPAAAEDKYPDKPIHMIVPLAPGGSNDVLARIIGQKMQEDWGQPAIIENRPGASGNIGTDYVAKAAPDGYTIGIAPSQTVSVNPALYPKLPFDVQKDLVGLSIIGRVPMVLVVNPGKIQATNVAQLIAELKKQPGKVTYASAGSGSPQHMSAEIFKSMTGTSMIQVPYKGSGPALVDVLAGNVDLMFCPLNSVLPHIRSGKVRALGSTGVRRIPLLPDVPTIADTVPGYESDIWIGMIAPSKTPAPIVEKINAELRKALALPDVKAKLAEQGIEAETSTVADFNKLIVSDQKRWAEVIRNANIQPD